MTSAEEKSGYSINPEFYQQALLRKVAELTEENLKLSAFTEQLVAENAELGERLERIKPKPSASSDTDSEGK